MKQKCKWKVLYQSVLFSKNIWWMIFMPFSVNHLMHLSSSCIYFSNHSIRDSEEYNLTCYNLAKSQIKEEKSLNKTRCFKASVFLSVLRNTRKSYRPICQILIVLQTETKSKFCPVLNFGNVLCLVNLIPLVSVSTSVFDLRSLLPECSPCPSLSV